MHVSTLQNLNKEAVQNAKEGKGNGMLGREGILKNSLEKMLYGTFILKEQCKFFYK